MKNIILFLGFSLVAPKSFGASYDTLPKGINMFAAKHVTTSKIESKFDANHQSASLALKENFTTSKLENISSALKSYFNELKAISPEAHEQFSLGEFEASAFAEVSAQGIGLAHGLTNNLTVYGSLPIYHIRTNVAFSQSQKSNLAAVQATVNKVPTTSAMSEFVKQLTMQLPETNEELLQSLLVNYYGYKPLGDWEKDALGDAELGAIYRLTDSSDMGLAVAAGVVLPTGEKDDENSLQDVATGDGQYDAFIENMAGASFFNGSVAFDLKTRFTYQFASKKNLRVLRDPYVSLSKDKELMSEKLGNKIDATAMATYNMKSWLNLNTAYVYNETGTSTYGTRDQNAKKIMENNSSTKSQWIRLGIGFSSLELYKQKKMDIPCEANLSAQRLMNAKNSANYDRIDLDFRFYF